MSTIAEIQADLDRGKLFYSELNSEYIDNLKSGCSCDLPPNYKCLRRLIKAIEWKISQGVVDDILEKLYFDLLIIIGEAPIVDTVTGYWGFSSTNTIPTYSQIIASNAITFASGDSVTVPFIVTDYSYYWFAIPSTQPIKNKYQDLSNPNNRGDIGTDQDLMNAPTLVTGVIPMNLYITNYLTIQNTPLKFYTV